MSDKPDLTWEQEMILKILLAADCDCEERTLNDKQIAGIINLIRDERFRAAEFVLRACAADQPAKKINAAFAKMCRKVARAGG